MMSLARTVLALAGGFLAAAFATGVLIAIATWAIIVVTTTTATAITVTTATTVSAATATAIATVTAAAATAVAALRFVRLALCFAESGEARQAHAALVVDADALDENFVTQLADVFDFLDAELGQFGNVYEAFLTG